MVFKYRITLEGLKGFFRVYLTEGSNSLYTFHKQIRSDLEFPQDQAILFKALNAEGKVVARYALVDLGFGTVDSVSIEDTVKAGVSSFVYFYDIQNKKSVNIQFEGQIPNESVNLPKLIESKGPVPAEFENGYVAFEDMPEERRKLPGLAETMGLRDIEEEEDDDEEEGIEDEEEEELVYEDNY